MNQIMPARSLEQFHTDHHEQIVRPNALEVLNKLVWHYDEPFADSSAIPTYYVSQVARQYVTVALGGDGGDESFAGYRRYYFDHMENHLRGLIPAGLRSTVFGPLGQIYPRWRGRRVFFAPKPRSRAWRAPRSKAISTPSRSSVPAKNRICLLPISAIPSAATIRLACCKQYYDRADTTDLLSRIQYVDIKTYLADDILAKVDRASMAVSLEVRAPLLDHKLMETIAKIPSSLKLVGREGKYIFKKAMAPILKPDILYRQKQGFAVPARSLVPRGLARTHPRCIVRFRRRNSESTVSEENLGPASKRRLQPLRTPVVGANVPQMASSVFRIVQQLAVTD